MKTLFIRNQAVNYLPKKRKKIVLKQVFFVLFYIHKNIFKSKKKILINK